MDKFIAANFELLARKEVVVQKVHPDHALIEFIEITFKDQYIGRSDMWRFKNYLSNTTVFVGKKLTFSCIRVCSCVPSFYL